MMNEKVYFATLKGLNEAVPYEDAKYFNMCFASALSKGVGLTEDKILKVLLNGVEDGFLSYSQALTLKEKYVKNLL